jgi:hypothetical protein
MSSSARLLLRAPGPIAGAAARLASEPDQRWMLAQPAAVRWSYADEVLGRPDEITLREAWMLRQDAAIRESYIAEVLGARRPPPRAEIWMLRQADVVRESYVREVLEAAD